MQFTIVHDTIAKKSTADSSTLPNNQKAFFYKNDTKSGELLGEKDNHLHIELDYQAGKWWFYKPHLSIKKTELQPGQLTKNFWLDELTRSETASRLGLDNIPYSNEINNLKILCEKVLQPTRDNYNMPLVITSGFRSIAVNSAVGGSPNSQHRYGQAADFTIPGIDNYDLAVWIRDHLNYDQLILEYYTGGNSGWIHVGYSSRHKNQELTINQYGTFNGLKRY